MQRALRVLILAVQACLEQHQGASGVWRQMELTLLLDETKDYEQANIAMTSLECEQVWICVDNGKATKAQCGVHPSQFYQAAVQIKYRPRVS